VIDGATVLPHDGRISGHFSADERVGKLIACGMPSHEDQQRIGVMGLGLMGTALVERLLEHGFRVTVWNRTREKSGPLIARGAEWSENPLADCRRVIISLYTTDVVEAVLAELDVGLHEGQILIDTTTGDSVQTAALGARLAGRGVRYLDAPISGSSQQTKSFFLEFEHNNRCKHFSATANAKSIFGCYRNTIVCKTNARSVLETTIVDHCHNSKVSHTRLEGTHNALSFGCIL
jgi:hypothetical protein